MHRLKNSVAILNEYNPQIVVALKNEYPNSELLSGLETWGNHTVSQLPETARIKEEVAIIIGSLTEIQKRIDPSINDIKRKLKRANRMKFYAAAISIVTSLLIAILHKNGKAIILPAILNMISSIFLLYANNLESPTMSTKKSLSDYFQSINQLYGKTERIIYHLEKKIKIGTFDEDISKLIVEGEEIAIELRMFQRDLSNTWF